MLLCYNTDIKWRWSHCIYVTSSFSYSASTHYNETKVIFSLNFQQSLCHFFNPVANITPSFHLRNMNENENKIKKHFVDPWQENWVVSFLRLKMLLIGTWIGKLIYVKSWSRKLNSFPNTISNSIRLDAVIREEVSHVDKHWDSSDTLFGNGENFLHKK